MHHESRLVCLLHLCQLKVYTLVWQGLQGDKDAHKATETAHDKAAKGNVANAKGHAKDAAKQTLGAADAKKDQAKTGKTACVIATSLQAKQTDHAPSDLRLLAGCRGH